MEWWRWVCILSNTKSNRIPFFQSTSPWRKYPTPERFLYHVSIQVEFSFTELLMFKPGNNPATFDPKLNGTILNLFIKTGNLRDIISLSINATTTGCDLVSYQYQSEARNFWFQIKSDDPQPVYKKHGTTQTQSCNLSPPLPLGAILTAIDINQKLLKIDPKLKGTLLSLFIKTGKDYSLAVNSTASTFATNFILDIKCYKLT